MGAGTRAVLLDRFRSEIHSVVIDARSWRERFERRTGLHEVWKRDLHLHRSCVLSPIAGRRARGLSPLCEPAWGFPIAMRHNEVRFLCAATESSRNVSQRGANELRPCPPQRAA